MSEPWNLTEAQRRQFREAHADAKRAPMAAPDFAETIPAADTDDPAKGWRVLDDSGNMQDYSVRPDACRAMYDASGSSAVYGRTRSGVWRLDETLLREG
jgi:hypothetical protein